MSLGDISGACLNDNLLLPIDTACFSIINHNDHVVTFFSGFDNCLICDGERITDLPPKSNTTIQVSTKYPLRIHYYDTGAATPYLWCFETYRFLEYGKYGWNISEGGSCSHIYAFYEPLNPFLLPMAIILLYLFVIIILCKSKSVIKSLMNICVKKFKKVQDDLYMLQETNGNSEMFTESKSDTRIQTLDTFWGITVLFMIFINNGGGKYYFFDYSVWDGFTLADLVLPWFAWAMGFTITISIHWHLSSVSQRKFILRQFCSVIILILFGLMINSQYNPSLSELRFTGALQFLAISYFFCMLNEICFIETHKNFQFNRFVFLQDVFERLAQWAIIIVVVTIHTFIINFIRIPGCPRGYTGPGGYHRRSDYINCTGGVAGYIDRFIFGHHMYMKTIDPVYGSVLPHDPEGLMNIVAAVLIVSMGVQAGRIFITYDEALSKIIRWKAWFFGTAILTIILTKGTVDKGIIPINKNMMSLSYILFTSSSAFLLFSTLYYLITHKKWWSGTPFIYAGANPFLLYIAHQLTMGLFPFSWKISENPTHTSFLIMDLWTTTIWGFITYFLYRKHIFISL